MDVALIVDPESSVPLYQQIYEGLRQATLSGRLKPGQKLPSSRDLAQHLAVSRLTVIESYDRLLSEGYFESRRGAGTYVSTALDESLLHATAEKPTAEVRLSSYGASLASAGDLWRERPAVPISFGYGRPAVEEFPLALWRRLQARHSDPALLDYTTDVAGYRPLREAISEYLAVARAIRCTPEQILIVNGSQHGVDLVARTLIEPGDVVAVENPGYLGARRTLLSTGASVRPIPVDAEGVQTAALAAPANADVRLIYVTPSHQFPTGATLPLPRRLELLAWAQRQGAIIVEDDYDSEYRYGERPIPALAGLDQHGSVLYLGTFSKVVFPALRIGYLVLPPGLVSVFRKAKWLSDRQSPQLDQATLAAFIREGHLGRHIKHMLALYGERREILIKALQAAFGKKVTVLGEKAGMHVMVHLQTGLSDEEVSQRALATGVALSSTRQNYVTEPPGGEFILGYAALDGAAIRDGIRRLASALH